MSRCQRSGSRGQCNQPAVDGSDFCSKHSKESDRIRSYRLRDENMRERFDHHYGSDSLETVRAEVVLLRTLIEDRLSLARNEAERIAAFNAVSPQISNVGKLVEILSRLEKQSNIVLGREALERLGDNIVEILIEELADVDGFESIIDRLAARIAGTIAETRNEE